MNQSRLNETLQPLVNLAKARELLIIDAERYMPKGGRAQRDKMVATIERVIGNALLATKERLPESPDDELDPVSKSALKYVVLKQSQALPPPANEGSAYDNLQRAFDERSNLHQTNELLEWLQNAHALPDPEAMAIDDATAATKIFEHRSMSQPAVRQMLEEIRTDPSALESSARRNFELMERLWLESAGLDETLVNNLSRACLASGKAWEIAKPQSNFSAWLPHLEEVVTLTRRKGQALGNEFKASPYQALLETFNSGLREEAVNRVFGELRARLPDLVKKVTEKQAVGEPPIPLPLVPVNDQRRVVRRLMKSLGLDHDHIVLGESAHPFTCGQWDDVRTTARYIEENFMFALMAIIHETGRVLYSRALPRKWKDWPIGEPQSVWVHESQSLFWQNQMASGRDFIDFLSPILKDKLGVDGPEWSPQNLYRLVTRVKPGLIRTEADEVTYTAHIILRRDLERKLIDGTLAPKNLPEAWDKGMRELLEVEVPDHAHGCMQDVHWSLGIIGYFPAYTFGAIAAAQLMEKLKHDMLDLSDRIRNGDFAPIRAWMTDRVHQYGSRYTGEDLMKNATGKPLSAEAWLNHVQRRYLEQGVTEKWETQLGLGKGGATTFG
jgi:carboxypeptidase Taq